MAPALHDPLKSRRTSRQSSAGRPWQRVMRLWWRLDAVCHEGVYVRDAERLLMSHRRRRRCCGPKKPQTPNAREHARYAVYGGFTPASLYRSQRPCGTLIYNWRIAWSLFHRRRHTSLLRIYESFSTIRLWIYTRYERIYVYQLRVIRTSIFHYNMYIICI